MVRRTAAHLSCSHWQTQVMLMRCWMNCSGQHWKPGPKVIKHFSCSTHLSIKFVLLINLKLLTIAYSFLLNIAEHENFSCNKYENCWHFHIYEQRNFILSWAEYEKSFITSGLMSATLSKLFCLPSEMKSTLKEKNLLPSFLLEKTSFQKGLSVQESKQEAQMLYPL